jgi:oligopeptide transport system substrate-binding protein
MEKCGRQCLRTAKGALVLALLLLAGCGQSAPRHIDPPGQMTFYRGNAAEPETLDPSLAMGNYEDNIMGDLMVGLLTFDAQARPIPGIATSWQTSKDGLTWTFKLRNALWSNGMPVTAQDFVFSWQRILDPKTAGKYAYFLYPLKNAEAISNGKLPLTALGAEALDDHTLKVTLEHPAPYMLQMLCHMTMYPEPRAVVQAKGNRWTRPGNYVSDGPYTLKEWIPNDHITLIKNPRFYDAAHVKVTKVIFYPTSDYNAALQRLRAGELDTQDALPGKKILWLRANMPELMHPVPQLTIEFLVSNQGRKPFNDVRVREALNMTIDREAITSKITRGGEIPAYNLIPPGIAGYSGGQYFAFKSLSHLQRIALAQKLMREAGYGPNHRLKTTYMIRSASNASSDLLGAALQQMWGAIYVDIRFVPVDVAIFYDRVEQHDFDIADAGWSADFSDASNFLDLLRSTNGNNYGQYKNPAYDAMLDAAQQDTNGVTRGQKLASAEAVALRDQAWMPLYFWVSRDLVRPYVKGWVPNPVDFHRTRWVWIDEKARAALLQ